MMTLGTITGTSSCGCRSAEWRHHIKCYDYSKLSSCTLPHYAAATAVLAFES